MGGRGAGGVCMKLLRGFGRGRGCHIMETQAPKPYCLLLYIILYESTRGSGLALLAHISVESMLPRCLFILINSAGITLKDL